MSKKKIILGLIFVAIFFAVYSDQKFEPENIEELRKISNEQIAPLPPKAFTTDGCSLWPNSILGNDLLDICISHDMQYWKGGSAEDRKVADNEMRERVNENIPFVGDVMYTGVRIFGHPLLPSPWRWGYGFEYPYKY